MNDLLKKLVSGLDQNPPLTEEQFHTILRDIPVNFPSDYLAYMKEFNGGEGVIGENGRYVRFWPFQELLEANEDYAVDKFAPGLFFIGSDGGDTAIGLKKEEGFFIEVPFIGMSDEEAVERGGTFTDLLIFLSR
ncbi:SMI1 / KNR4 family (SUKH-1) [Chitinophaga terrae (ex Kim and Jung 2007)]|uniref:SMI1 / KNR4 family (SUKH-1) n=1 Tax=Chitinophaga terrae (ex Kim and Jung 2007) TaxID=408074 RepID=A0A1H4CFV5_9BACT|nr:SMI1/KNR4 family protein [Chitinophaga terrae (ex Kim and Jung 2007)]GEP88938.1 hypothetical protein CTE07_05830 [Chitinophaga terrae (ex Kim and Jung 2007)]SEA58952.1 SMI1 / KNR4 family (SUKH-1) [Chitinophaga terrae (ex Kim and Jung 2007)]